MTITELKAEQSKKLDELMKEHSVFFAFSNEQFEEGKTPLQPGEKYVSMGAGGYIPQSKLDSFLKGMEAINKWYKDSIKANNMRKKQIAYELANHEAYYTNEIEDTLQALGPDFTREEVLEVFNKERKKQNS